jgi:hypothetical protein
MGTPVGNLDESGTFKVTNKSPQGLNVGVICDLTVGNGASVGPSSDVNGAFYVTPMQVLKDYTVKLTPIDKVTVWFEADASTGAMIGTIDSPHIIVDFTGNNLKTQTIAYNQQGMWQLGKLQ